MQGHLVKVVLVDMRVSCCMDKLSGLQAANLGYHHSEESVRSNVERDAKEDVCASLVQLAGEFTICHIELEQAVARRKGHLVHFCGIPGGYQHSSGVGIVLYQVDYL